MYDCKKVTPPTFTKTFDSDNERSTERGEDENKV